MTKELRIAAIEEGTVIDHIPPGRGLKVLRVLALEQHPSVISLVVNVPSGKLGKKDVVKVEKRLLSKEETDRLALIAPSATVNLIRNHDVVQKNQVTAPKELEGLLRCFNPNCVTNHEKARTRFTMLQSSPLRVRCHYCERVMEEPDVLEHL